MLGPLKNNGGATKTHAPLSNSPAIDRGKHLGSGTAEDQRGLGRGINYGSGISSAGDW
jgi:hypothetical protein